MPYTDGEHGKRVGTQWATSGDPAKRAQAIVKATTFHDDPEMIVKVSRGLGEAALARLRIGCSTTRGPVGREHPVATP